MTCNIQTTKCPFVENIQYLRIRSCEKKRKKLVVNLFKQKLYKSNEYLTAVDREFTVATNLATEVHVRLAVLEEKLITKLLE